MTTRCVIVDDEPLAIEIVENYLNRLEDFEIVAKCLNALEAFRILEEEKVDLLFLDIQMPQLTGIEFLKSLRNPPQVIFTTAYVDYAVEGYELDVLDYLVKPISFERFFKSINKYKGTINSVREAVSTEPIQNENKEYIVVNENKKNVRIRLEEILYIESLKDYIKIHQIDRSTVIKMTLMEIISNLPTTQFLRVHRSYIINQSKVTAHTSMDIEIGKIEIPIGISYKQKVIDTLFK